MRVLVVLSILSAFLVGLSFQDSIYNGCFCEFEWNDAVRVGNLTVPENWLQREAPVQVAFVNISGDNIIHVDQPRTINSLLVGENRWDNTKLVLDYDLTVYYDDHPVITAVRGVRLVTGQIELTVEGYGFGFESSGIVVTAYDYFVPDGVLEVGGFFNSPNPSPDWTAYDCVGPSLQYRDEKVVCTISAVDVLPYTFFVVLQANGFTAQAALLSKFIK